MKSNKNNQNISSLFNDYKNKKSSDLSGFNSYFKENFHKKSEDKTEIQDKSKNSIKEKNINNSINSMEFVQDIKLEENSSSENKEMVKDFGNLSIIEKNNKNEFYNTNESLFENNLDLFSNLEKYNYLVENLDLQKLKKYNGQILQCLLGKKSGNDNQECNCIPIIKFHKNHLSFYCEHHSKEQYVTKKPFVLFENLDKI